MNSIFVNMLIEWQGIDGGMRIERVLWANPSGEHIVTIDIQNERALPSWQKYEAIEIALASNQACVLEIDPYAKLHRPEDTIPANHRKYRDKAWAVIEPLVEDKSGKIFVRAERGPLVKAAVERTKLTKTTIYKYLRRYWQGGQTKNALLPYFDQCGGKGQERKSGERKRGRPSDLARITYQPTGVNVNADIQEYFQRGIKLFYENRKSRRLSEAFQLTLERFFHQGYELRDGVLVPILPPAEERPTLRQFRYWYEKGRDPIQAITSRAGSRRIR